MAENSVTADPIPPNAEIIEVLAEDLLQLFNPIDPTPLRERDLDPRVEAFIVDWSREVSRQKPLALLVRMSREADSGEAETLLRDAVRRFFRERAQSSRRQLRQLFHRGRISLAIGLAVLATFTTAAQLVTMTDSGGVAQILRESLAIGGWVAMWRPLEVFLYDWWPISADAKLFDRLAAMPVRISYTT